MKQISTVIPAKAGIHDKKNGIRFIATLQPEWQDTFATTLLFLLIFFSYTACIFAQDSDEWAIFNEPEQNSQTEKNPEYNSQYSIRTDLRKINQNPDSVLNPNGDVFDANQMYGLFQFDTRQELQFRKILKFVFDGSATGITEKHENSAGYAENSILSFDAGKKFPDISYSEFIILKELYIEYNVLKNLFIDAGLLGINYGSNWLVNPVNYFAKFYSSQLNILDKQYYTIPSVKAGLIIDKFNLSLLYIPWIKGNDNQFMEGAFCYNSWQNPGHIVIIRNDLLLNNNKFSFYLYGEKSKTDSNGKYGGIGMEFISPIFSWMNLNVQGTYLNGNKKSKIIKYNYNAADYYYLEQEPGSDKDFNLSGLLGFDFNIMNFANLGINYFYNQAGLDKKEYNEMVKGLSAAVNNDAYKNYSDPEFFRNAGFLYSVLRIYDPFKLRKNYMFISINKSNILEILMVNINSIVCLDDFSAMLYLMIKADYWENIEIFADGMISTGARYNVFGMNPVNGQFSAGVKLFF
jgi:hypothetical protein